MGAALKKLWARLTGRRAPAPRRALQPLILRTSGEIPAPREIEARDPAAVEAAESDMNIAMRSILNVMALEGLITRDQAREFAETHGVVVAYRGCGLSGLLRGIGTPEDDIKANRSRVVVVRLPIRDIYSTRDVD